jgi:hypothetical protein
MPTLERLFKRDVQRGKLDDYRLTKMYLKNKLSDVAKKKFKGGMMKRKMLTGGQAKLDKNKNNKIDAEDFKILRQQKSKKKPMKAALGAIALGAMTAAKLKKLKGKKTKMPGAAGVMGSGLIPGMSVADIIQKKLKRSKGGGADYNRPKSADDIIQAAVRDKGKAQGRRRPSMRDKELEGDIKGSIAPYKVKKKMGGGMMMRPMGYKAGKSVKVKCKIGRNKPTKMY